MEGGGQTAEAKAAIRQGMGEFLRSLRESARRKGWHWKVVACGSRTQARDAFLNARTQEPTVQAILLVDAETAVTGASRQHLATHDRWPLAGVPDLDVHLMAQVMETWLVSDPEALHAFYGQGFHAGALPSHVDLEQVSKEQIAQSLENATKGTQKGRYHKVDHGSRLLERVQPAVARGRCQHCERLFSVLGTLVT
jgi:hypothetical protein